MVAVHRVEPHPEAVAQFVLELHVPAGGKLLYLFCLLAGTWLFVRRASLPRIGVGTGLAFIAGVALLFVLAPADLNPLVAWQAGITVPVFLICGGLLAGLPRERRTRGSQLLSLVCFLVAALWLLYTPAFLEAGPANVPGRLGFLRWLASHNSFFDLMFEFMLGFGMILAVLDDVFNEAEEERTSHLRDVAASEARLSQIIRAASEGIILLDADRRIVHSNPAAREILGTSEEALTGESFDRFVTTTGTEDLWAVATDGTASTPAGGYELLRPACRRHRVSAGNLDAGDRERGGRGSRSHSARPHPAGSGRAGAGADAVPGGPDGAA